MQRSWKGIVGRLAFIDMVIGMDRRLAAARARQQFIGPPSNHFVDIHIGLRARACLPDDQGELIVERARDDVACRVLNGLRNLGG